MKVYIKSSRDEEVSRLENEMRNKLSALSITNQTVADLVWEYLSENNLSILTIDDNTLWEYIRRACHDMRELNVEIGEDTNADEDAVFDYFATNRALNSRIRQLMNRG